MVDREKNSSHLPQKWELDGTGPNSSSTPALLTMGNKVH